MAPRYTDKRFRYNGLSSADFVPGSARWDNPQKFTGRREPAPQSSVRPRDRFRVTSVPVAPVEPEPVLPPPNPNAVPSPDSFELPPPDALSEDWYNACLL